MKTNFNGKEYIEHLPQELQDILKEEVKEECIVVRKGINIKSDEEKTFSAILSSSQIDRDEEVLVSAGIDIKAYKSNPVVLWSHNWGTPPVGSASIIDKQETELKIKVQMADTPFANDLWTLIKGKHLRTMSIGFIPIETLYSGTKEFDQWYKDNKQTYKGADRARRIFTKSILLEGSLVSIPANTGANIIEVSKNFDPESLKNLGLEKKEVKVISKVLQLPVDDNKLIQQYLKDAIDILTGKI